MTRKHFIELAYQISLIGDLAARQAACKAVSEACWKFNPAFDAYKFAVACNAAQTGE